MRILLYISFLLLPIINWSQSTIQFDLTVNKNKVEVGEPVDGHLLLSFSDAALDGTSKENVNYPILTDSTKFKNIEIWEASSPVDTIETDNLGTNTYIYQQDFTFAVFDTGTIEFPPLSAIINEDTINSNAVSLLVSFAPIDPQGDFKDIKTLENDPLTLWEKIRLWLKNNWIILSVISLVLLSIILLIYKLNNKKAPAETKPKIPTPERLLYRLNEIEQNKLWQKDKLKQYYTEISEVVDEYLNYRFEIPTFEKTSHEILSSLKLKAIEKVDLEQLEKLFFLSDMVKFAKSLPSPEENKEALLIARELIKKYKSKEPTETIN